MDPITGLIASQALQAVSNLTTRSEEPEQSESEEQGNDFDLVMRKLLVPDAGNQVNEEELFAALVHERVVSLKGEEAGTEFHAAFDSARASSRRPDGYEFIEDSTYAGLDALVESGTLTEEEAHSIKSEAFTAAQLDDNHNALYDGRGGPGDSTVATSDMESALASAKLLLDKLAIGEITPLGTADSDQIGLSLEGESSQITPSGNSIDGTDGFLFKPEGDTTGKVVVLLPPDLTGEIESVVLKDKSRETIEEGEYSGNANGGREHFRFDKAGSDYPEDIHVEVTLKDGSVRIYDIPNPSERYD
ncbi:MAG: hypothetical protein KDD42_07485 [Bdellovibrionales bacterium]|nr:hypothetical protein [Bdellovibrionales bacterium]